MHIHNTVRAHKLHTPTKMAEPQDTEEIEEIKDIEDTEFSPEVHVVFLQLEVIDLNNQLELLRNENMLLRNYVESGQHVSNIIVNS